MPLSKRSRRGAFWLLVISGVTALLPRVITGWMAEDFDDPVISHEAFATISEQILEAEAERNKNWQSSNERKFIGPPHRFDPNQYSKNDWINLGLSDKQADVVLRFSERGLYSNDDLQRIFVIPEKLFLLIKDSTFYPERPQNNYSRPSTARETLYLNINTASKEELMKIPGIGAYFADKMVFFREKLGGYVSREQLLEIKKFDAQKLKDIEQYIYLGNSEIRKLDVNTADFESLNAHPYITYEVANSIVKMRAQKPYERIEDIKRSKLIDDEIYEKLLPYLTIQ